MRSQAPFEPSYLQINFNTMPLYPILIGLGRLVGIDGIWAIKFWPLLFMSLSLILLAWVPRKMGAPLWVSALAVGAAMADPTIRWASVLVRPESLVGLAGISIVFYLTYGARRVPSRGLWDPLAFAMAIAAYAHFNAVHLVLPVFIVLLGHVMQRPTELVRVGLLTLLYLSPWLFMVMLHWGPFMQQMHTQFERLALGNPWLSSLPAAISSIYQELGSPVPMRSWIRASAIAFWILTLLALGWGLLGIFRSLSPRVGSTQDPSLKPPSLEPATLWLLSALYLWHRKPEVWFTYFHHLALWTWVAIALHRAWLLRTKTAARTARALTAPLSTLITVGLTSLILTINAGAALTLARDISRASYWSWGSYLKWVDCIDQRILRRYPGGIAQEQGKTRPLKVWGPTPPDVLVTLSKRHPDWNLTRVNDFPARTLLALEHGHQVDAMVTTEVLNWDEREIDGPMDEHPDVQSSWMNWDEYFLKDFLAMPDWLPERHICQVGRWQAFIYLRASTP